MSRPTCATCPHFADAEFTGVDDGEVIRLCPIKRDLRTPDDFCGEHPDMPAWLAQRKEEEDG